MSGPRTNPTVKSVSSMNKKNLDRWEVRLGVAQVVIILGIVTGCMTFAFYLGFFAGKSAGFEFAMETNATSATKLPITGEGVGDKAAIDVTEQAVSDVYARLNERAKKEAPVDLGTEEVPSLDSIKETEPKVEEPASILPDTTVSEAKVAKTKELDEVWDSGLPSDKKADSSVKILGDEAPSAAKSAAKVNPAADDIFDDEMPTHPVDRALDASNAPKKLLNEEKLPEKSPPVEKEVKKEVVKPTATPVPPTPTPKKEKEEAKKASEGAAIVRGPIPSGWFAQVAAPTKMKDAETIAAKLKKNGFRVVIETAKVRGDEYYRILVGPEQNKKQAELLVGQLSRESYVEGAPFIRMVK